VYVHAGPDGNRKPDCNRRRQYLVRGLPPAQFVQFMLHRFGFQAEHAGEIINEIARTPRAAR